MYAYKGVATMPLLPEPDDICTEDCIHPESVQAARRIVLPLPDAQDVAAIFAALADPTRVRLLQALSERELCVCDLSLVLGLKQPAVSQHLRVLRGQRIVRYRKEGRVAYYILDNPHVAALLQQGIAQVQSASADEVAAGVA